MRCPRPSDAVHAFLQLQLRRLLQAGRWLGGLLPDEA
jgi:hypothetical protein